MEVGPNPSLIPPLEPEFSSGLELGLNGPYRTSYGKPFPSRSLVFWTRFDLALLRELTKSNPEFIQDIMQMQWLENQEAVQEFQQDLIATAWENQIKRLATTTPLTLKNNESIWKTDNMSESNRASPVPVLLNPLSFDYAYFDDQTSEYISDLINWPYWSVFPAEFGHFLQFPVGETYSTDAPLYIPYESHDDNGGFASSKLHTAAIPEVNYSLVSDESAPTVAESQSTRTRSKLYRALLASGALPQDHAEIINKQNTYRKTNDEKDYDSYLSSFGNLTQEKLVDVDANEENGSVQTINACCDSIIMENYYGENLCDYNNFEIFSSSEDEDKENPSPIIEIRGNRNYTYNNLRKKGTLGEYLCVFCNGNDEPEDVCKSHPIRANGKIVCPSLRTHVCALCKATGDSAHTIKYCPQNKRGFFAMKAMQRAMNNAGSPRLRTKDLTIRIPSTKSNIDISTIDFKTQLPSSSSVRDKAPRRLKRRVVSDENKDPSNTFTLKALQKNANDPRSPLRELVRLRN